MTYERLRRGRLALTALSLAFSMLACTPNSSDNAQPDPSGSAQAGELTEVDQLATPNITAKQGQSITLTTKFNAVPMDKNYIVFMHFVDSTGKQMPLSGDYTPTTPTTQWSGAVTYNRTLTVPSTFPNGVYSIRVGLYENVAPYTNRATMNPGPGVTVDSEKRYTVGTLTVGSVSAPAQYTLSIASPAAGATVSGSVQIKGMGPGFKNVEVYNSAGAMLARSTPDATGNFTATVDTTKLSNGSQTLKISAWDSAAGTAFTKTAETKLTLNVQNGTAPAPAPAPAPTPAPTAPTITSGPTVSEITASTAKITWTVSEKATGQIEYGTTTAYGKLSNAENTFNYSTHIQTLSGLTAGTTYHYRVVSKNAAGQQVASSDKTFATTGSAPAPAPAPTPAPAPAPAPDPAPSYTLTMSAPAANATVSGTITVKGTGPGFKNVEIYSAAGAMLARSTPDSAGAFSATVDTTKLFNGSQVLTIDAWDSAPGTAFTHTAEAKLTVNVQNAGASNPPASGTTPVGGPGGYTKVVMNDSFGSSKAGANITSLNQFNQGTYGRAGTGWDDYMCAWDCGKANLLMAGDHLELRPTGGKSGFISSRFEWLPQGAERVYYEVRMATGRGATSPQTWPAVWLFAGNEPGSNNAQSEFDIMETYMNQWDSMGNDSSGYPFHFSTVIHDNANVSSEFKIIETPGVDVTTSYNVYGTEVYRGSNGNLQFNVYFNGKLVYQTSSGLTWRSSPPSLFIGWNPGSTSWAPSVMKLDYVKAWVK